MASPLEYSMEGNVAFPFDGLSATDQAEISGLLLSIVDAVVDAANTVSESTKPVNSSTISREISPQIKIEGFPAAPSHNRQPALTEDFFAATATEENHDGPADGNNPKLAPTTMARQPSDGLASPPPINRRPEKLRFSIRNDTTRIFFSSRGDRPLIAALRRFSQKIEVAIEIMRWTYEGVRVRGDQTPMDIGMEVGQDNIIWAYKEAVGGSAIVQDL